MTLERRKPLRANPETTRAWQDRSRKPLSRSGPIDRGESLKRTGPLARRGAKAKRAEPALRRAYAEVDQRDGGCVFGVLDRTHRCPPNALLHHDHLWGRLVRPDLREDPRGIVLLCSVAHDEVTRDPKLHRELRRAVLEGRTLVELREACPRPLRAPLPWVAGF